MRCTHWVLNGSQHFGVCHFALIERGQLNTKYICIIYLFYFTTVTSNRTACPFNTRSEEEKTMKSCRTLRII